MITGDRQDHRPDAERPEDILGGKALRFKEGIVLGVHDAPAFFCLVGHRYSSTFKNPAAVSLAFDHRRYHRLTTWAPGPLQPVSRRNASTGDRPRMDAHRPNDDTSRMSCMRCVHTHDRYLVSPTIASSFGFHHFFFVIRSDPRLSL